MKTQIIIVLAALSLPACTTLSEPLDPDFGKAVHAAYDLQIVSKTAVPGAPTPDAAVQANAIDRYRTDTVKKPKEDTISSIKISGN